MTSYPSNNWKPKPIQAPPFIDVREAEEKMRFALCKVRCRDIMSTWYTLCKFHDLEQWFSSSQCCLPLSLYELLNQRNIASEDTTKNA